MNEASLDTLLLTGTISPVAGQPWLVITDPQVRLRQYIKAMILWIRSGTFRKICFCENSHFEFDFSGLQEYASSHGQILEILRLPGDEERTATEGKSFGEGELIRQARGMSQIVKNSPTFWKVTGRLYIGNIGEIVRRNRSAQNLFVTHHPMRKRISMELMRLLRRSGPRRWPEIQTYFFRCRPDDYDSYLSDAHANAGDISGRFNLENCFARRIERFPRFRLMDPGDLEVIGMSASHGRPYDSKARDYRDIYSTVDELTEAFISGKGLHEKYLAACP